MTTDDIKEAARRAWQLAMRYDEAVHKDENYCLETEFFAEFNKRIDRLEEEDLDNADRETPTAQPTGPTQAQT